MDAFRVSDTEANILGLDLGSPHGLSPCNRGPLKGALSSLPYEDTVRRHRLWPKNRPSWGIKFAGTSILDFPPSAGCHYSRCVLVTAACVGQENQGRVPSKGHSRWSGVPGDGAMAEGLGQEKGQSTKAPNVRCHLTRRKGHTSHWKHNVDSVQGGVVRDRAYTGSAGNEIQLTSNECSGWAGQQNHAGVKVMSLKSLTLWTGECCQPYGICACYTKYIFIICPQVERHTFGRQKVSNLFCSH